MRIILLFALAVVLAFPAADACIDDTCFPASPVGPVGVYRVWLPVVWGE